MLETSVKFNLYKKDLLLVYHTLNVEILIFYLDLFCCILCLYPFLGGGASSQRNHRKAVSIFHTQKVIIHFITKNFSLVIRFDPSCPGLRLDRSATQDQDVWVPFTGAFVSCSSVVLGDNIPSGIACYKIFPKLCYMKHKSQKDHFVNCYVNKIPESRTWEFYSFLRRFIHLAQYFPNLFYSQNSSFSAIFKKIVFCRTHLDKLCF